MEKWYKEDLAYIHNDGFSDYALKSAPYLLEILAQNGLENGLIVDLGCGSGLTAQELIKANYQVLGIDISESLIEIALAKVPNAEFRVESLFKADIPTCSAVLSIGECFNYLFDKNNNHQAIFELFQKIYNALIPGGIFIFDIAESGQIPSGTITKWFTKSQDWIVLVEKEENYEQKILTRRIITFRQLGEYYRRDDEIHQLRLYDATKITQILHRVGFKVYTMCSYGQYDLPPAHIAFFARRLRLESDDSSKSVN